MYACMPDNENSKTNARGSLPFLCATFTKLKKGVDIPNGMVYAKAVAKSTAPNTQQQSGVSWLHNITESR